ncbi:MAG TPA: ATP-binding protein [Pyrinomonadaceae bacterium]|jgi:PAS domain S-box-containing protein|nr:ATP-binding protein [Pyrinomonadaceae bacterium]
MFEEIKDSLPPGIKQESLVDQPVPEGSVQTPVGRATEPREERYRNIAEAIPQIVWTARPDGWLDYFNQRWFDYTGLKLEQTAGWGWQLVLHPDDLERSLEQWKQSVDTGRAYEVEYRLKRAADGAYRWHLVRALALRNNAGEIVKWFGTCTEIQDQKQVQEVRSRLLAREQEARKQAEETSRAKDEFLAIVSHELRTPLTAIYGWARMLRTTDLDEAAQEHALEVIEQSARAQTRLIEDLLDVSRIVTGKIHIDPRPVELLPVIESAIDQVRAAAETKNIRLYHSLDAKTGPVSGDPDRLQQIVWNLLSNAIKFTPEGGRVEIRLERTETTIDIIVSDTGIGINKDFIPFVFDRFRQADSSSTRAHGGLGLGLSIVRHLVELHNGAVEVDSFGEGQGATFRVKLPVMAMHVEERRKADPLRAGSNGAPSYLRPPTLDNLRVMIVDDESATRELLTMILKQNGAEVIAVASTAEALDNIRQKRPDVLVSDIEMPGEDGYRLILRVRAFEAEHGGRIPAAALTAYARTEDRVRALSAGFQIHVPKPVEPNELVTVVASLAGRTVKNQ